MNQNNPLLKIIILAVIFGLGAGVVGQLLTAAYLIPEEIFVFGEASRVRQAADQTTENEKILETERSTSPAVLEIFPQKNSSHDPLSQIYLPLDRVALGVALTSDGWLISYGKNLADPKSHFTIVTADQKIFSPQKIIFDEATGTVFIKIETQNLAVPKLGAYENLSAGEKVLIPFSKQSFRTMQIADLAHEPINGQNDLLKSSEKLSKLILLDGEVAAHEIGAPISNLDGEITGIISATSPAAAVPINYWRAAFLSILKMEKVNRPYLGVHYLDLGKSAGISETFSQGKTNGALIWSGKNPQVSGVTKGSPAAKSGLRDGDIILKINGDELNQRIDFSEIISEYSPGDKIQIAVLRNGEEKILEATLGAK